MQKEIRNTKYIKTTNFTNARFPPLKKVNPKTNENTITIKTYRLDKINTKKQKNKQAEDLTNKTQKT